MAVVSGIGKVFATSKARAEALRALNVYRIDAMCR
jgi:hypothetical protein